MIHPIFFFAYFVGGFITFVTLVEYTTRDGRDLVIAGATWPLWVPVWIVVRCLRMLPMLWRSGT